MSALFIQYMTKKRDIWGGSMKRRTLLGGTITVAMLGLTSRVGAQQPPIKIGMSMPQTGGLAGGGKASLLCIEIWRGAVNARGGLRRRQVHCASGGRPGIRPESGADREGCRKEAQHADRLRPGLSAQHGGILQHYPRAQGRQA